MKNIFILSLVLMLVFSSIVYASAENIKKIESNPEMGFSKMVGAVANIDKDEKGIKVSFKEDGAKEVGWVLLLSDDSIVIDGKNGKMVAIGELKKDQKLDVYYRKHTPVLQSYPAQFSPTVIFIPAEDGYYSDVDYYDEHGNGHEARLVINNPENSTIVNIKVEKRLVKDILNKDLIVLYKNSTRSLPPQTNPDKIIILEDVGVKNSHEIKLSGNPIIYTLEPVSQNGEKLYPIRQIFENAGGKVEWQDSTKTIEIKISSQVIRINTKTKLVIVGDKEFTLKGLTIVDGRTYSSSELFK